MSVLSPSLDQSNPAFFDSVATRPYQTAEERRRFGIGEYSPKAVAERELTQRERPSSPSRNNSNSASGGVPEDVWTKNPRFRFPRPYVQACCKGSLALYFESGRVVFRALACNSWSCPHCRKQKAANLLDRLRRGMASRPSSKRALVTLTVDPSKFGGRYVGTSFYTRNEKPFAGHVSDQVLDELVRRGELRKVRMFAPPSEEQYRHTYQAMSKELDRLRSRLNRRAQRMELDKWRYFRVVELHRNGWPHYHLVFEHPVLSIEEVAPQLALWRLGRIDYRPVASLDELVGEVAPYLTSPESSVKAYQFAASALPKHFRLWSCSKGFLGPKEEGDPEADKPLYGFPVRGHFTSYGQMYEQHCQAQEVMSQSLELVHVPTPGPLELPSTSRYTRIACTAGGSASQVELQGEQALVFFTNLLSAESLEAPPGWFRSEHSTYMQKEDRYKVFESLMNKCIKEEHI